MARFLQDYFVEEQKQDALDLPGLDDEALWGVKQILELGSGTGIGVMPLIRYYASRGS